MDTLTFDFVVIGSGLAGSTAALLLSKYGEVALLSKEPPPQSNSFAAQGGIAAAMNQLDSPELHLHDTLYAGDGLCESKIVERLVSRAAEYMNWLMDIGVSFDRTKENTLSLGLEGAHSQARILHAGGDATGANVLNVLTERVQSNARIWTGHNICVRSLIQYNGSVHGALVTTDQKQQVILGTRATILATGGLGQLYGATTNPQGALGEGIALAYEAGAIIRNMEFVQFHPTAMQMEPTTKFLVSEAVRGAGAILIDDTGMHIMADHPQKDLAPRDQVARRIYQVQQIGKQVFLDGTSISEFDKKFPTIYANCRSLGIDPKSQPIPVTPAAHFAMGGIMSDLNGRTTVPGLYAVGEVACTGVHGANRLASNSMLECIGMAHELADHLRNCKPFPNVTTDLYTQSHIETIEQEPPELIRNIQQIMWKAAGIVRDSSSLNCGLQHLSTLRKEYPQSKVVTTAKLILQSALIRTESRGAHYRIDYPDHDDSFIHDTIISKNPSEMKSVS